MPGYLSVNFIIITKNSIILIDGKNLTFVKEEKGF